MLGIGALGRLLAFVWLSGSVAPDKAAAAASKATRMRYQHAPDLEEEAKLLFCST